MCVKQWDGEDYKLRIERREKPRTDGLIEKYLTITYNSLRTHSPESMEQKAA
jgi:hypothetical protein